MSILPDSRYLWRELLPRFAVLSLLFLCVVNFVPGLSFSGGYIAALVLGFVMTVHFMLLGAYFFGWTPVTAFIERNQSKCWLQPAMIAFALCEPAPVLWLVSHLSFGAFSVHGVVAALCGSLIFNAGCALTHDWGRR